MANSDSILSMTEHAAFVWPSYAIVALVLVGLVVSSLRALARTGADLTDAEKTARDRRDEA